MSDIWETIKVEPCIVRPGDKVGWVYFVACKETMRCKIGFTAGEVEKRMKNLQTGAAGELRLIAKHPGTPDTERKLHERFANQRLHGEWFEMSEELFAYMCLTVWNMAKIYQAQGWPQEQWLITGLRMMHEDVGPLPDDLADLIKDYE